ncbi:hypothetical protein L208DRAFT_1394498, partial [Tricholoma matsutake]
MSVLVPLLDEHAGLVLASLLLIPASPLILQVMVSCPLYYQVWFVVLLVPPIVVSLSPMLPVAVSSVLPVAVSVVVPGAAVAVSLSLVLPVTVSLSYMLPFVVSQSLLHHCIKTRGFTPVSQSYMPHLFSILRLWHGVVRETCLHLSAILHCSCVMLLNSCLIIHGDSGLPYLIHAHLSHNRMLHHDFYACWLSMLCMPVQIHCRLMLIALQSHKYTSKFFATLRNSLQHLETL